MGKPNRRIINKFKKGNLMKYIIKIITPIIYTVSLYGSFHEHFQKGNDLFCNGQLESAIINYKEAIKLNPDCQQAYFNLGLIYSQQKNHQDALLYYLKACDLCKTYTKALVQAGNSYRELKEYDNAITFYKKGLLIDQNSFDCFVGLARTQQNMGRFEESIFNFKAALAIKPHDTHTMLEFANTLNMANHTHHALEVYHKILQILPNNTSTLYNIAYTLKKLNRIEEALPYYDKVLSLEPDHSEAHFGLGLAFLAQGNFERGWQEYEWRWKREGQGGPRMLSKPLWDGASLNNKTILLHAEQGLGDTLQFIRYAQEIKKRYDVKIIFASQDALIPLMKLCPYLDQIVSLRDQVPYHDTQAPLLSLPYIMKTRIESIPCSIPYLYADQNLVQLWKEKLDKNNFKVGICWQGNSNYNTHFLRTTVAAKSIKLQQFTPLFSLENVTVYNLQKNTGESQTQDIKHYPSFISFDKTFDDTHGRFMDTAAVIKNLDLMITIDTSMAHLAAGLGIPTWVLLPEPADWRWMIDKTDTPWYPNMRLFRQSTAGNWEPVIQYIIDTLIKTINDNPKRTNTQTINNAIRAIQSKINTLEKEKKFNDELFQLSKKLTFLVEERRHLLKKSE
jgi:tetratricopeptide (TPR) repeat protein